MPGLTIADRTPGWAGTHALASVPRSARGCLVWWTTWVGEGPVVFHSLLPGPCEQRLAPHRAPAPGRRRRARQSLAVMRSTVTTKPPFCPPGPRARAEEQLSALRVGRGKVFGGRVV